MRDRLKQYNPVKYSNRPSLDNDLRVLAAACKHIPPADGTDLCALINDYKDTIRQKTGFCHLIYLSNVRSMFLLCQIRVTECLFESRVLLVF